MASRIGMLPQHMETNMIDKFIGVLCGGLSCALLGFLASVAFYSNGGDGIPWALAAAILTPIGAGLGVIVGAIIAYFDKPSSNWTSYAVSGIGGSAALHLIAVLSTPTSNTYMFENLLAAILTGIFAATGYYLGVQKLVPWAKSNEDSAS